MIRFTWQTGVVLTLAVAACSIDNAPTGLRSTPPGAGPLVMFDLDNRPLPTLPLPNDLATIADPSSRTGRRINVSMVAPSGMERAARAGFNDMEGWGTSAPISVQFARDAKTPGTSAAIDLDDVRSRMQKDDHDFTNDPVYVINLTTGVPVMLDMGDGNYPLTLRDTDSYWANDLKSGEQNLLFETQEEGAGLSQADYRPALDNDFDGVLDHPNTLGTAALVPAVDNLLTWYERETDTLILRPLLPMDEKTEYAVVLTDRLRGPDREPVRSPFPSVHHPAQRTAIARARAVLGDASKRNYYGDLAGSGLDHVAFAWSFTTEPVQEDMRLLRDGLYGKGVFSRFATDFPPKVTILRAAGKAIAKEDESPGWQSDPKCAPRAKTPYTVFLDDEVRTVFHDFFLQVIGYDAGHTKALDEAITNIDHIVIGTFASPFLMGDPASTDEDTRFHVNFQTGRADVQADAVHFWIVVPKAKAGLTQPFPITFWGHGAGGNDTEGMLYAGDFARQGIATIGLDMPGHGIAFDVASHTLAAAELTPRCLAPWTQALASGRAHDLNFDGTPDSGAFWWTAHIFHTRDNVRQGILDSLQATRILRTFDGVTLSDQSFDASGKSSLAGDFDGNGTPDVGGNAPIFAAGESLGGIVSEIQGGIDPYLTAVAPMSGGGGLLDVASRSYGVTETVVEQQLSPLFVSVLASERPLRKDVPQTRCTGDQRSVRSVVNEGPSSVELEIACVNTAELDERMTVVITNVKNHERRCARTAKDGRFRISLPSTAGDKIDIQIYNATDAVTSYKGCDVVDGAPAGRRITTWEVAATQLKALADDTKICNSDRGCQQFLNRFYPVGSDLVAAQDGLGLSRQTPEFRRLRDLAQAAVDGADPVNFAPYYMLRALVDENGHAAGPRALLSISTIGDGFVSISTGMEFARAAGAIPFLPPSAVTSMPEYAEYATPPALYDAYGGKTPNQVLIDNGVVEGIARLRRTSAGKSCGVNYAASDICTGAPKVDPDTCAQTLFDSDWISQGGQHFDQPHLAAPLRLARLAETRVTDASSLTQAWTPRLAGVPLTADGNGWQANAKVVANLNMYVDPKGKHTWDAGDRCKAWDEATYGNGMIARFFASGGKDLFYLSHPGSHTCLVDLSCSFLK